MLCIKEFVFEFGQYGPLRQAITISSIFNKLFRTMFLEPDTVGIITERGTEWETASVLRPFNGWRMSI